MGMPRQAHVGGYREGVTAWLAHMPENCEGMHGNPMMRSGGLSEGRSRSRSPRMEAGEPPEGRSVKQQ